MSKIKRLPDAELEIMNALWDADAPLTAAELDGKPLGGKDPALLDKLQKAYQQWFNEETAK